MTYRSHDEGDSFEGQNRSPREVVSPFVVPGFGEPEFVQNSLNDGIAIHRVWNCGVMRVLQHHTKVIR